MTEEPRELSPEEAAEHPFTAPNHRVDRGGRAGPAKAPPAKAAKPRTNRSTRRNLFGQEVPVKDRLSAPPLDDDEFDYQPGMFVKSLEDLYLGIAMTLMPVKPDIANAVAMNSRKCAEAWDQLAKESPAVRRYLKKLMTGSAGFGVFMAHMPILTTVALSVPAVQKMMGARVADQAEQYVNDGGM